MFKQACSQTRNTIYGIIGTTQISASHIIVQMGNEKEY